MFYYPSEDYKLYGFDFHDWNGNQICSLRYENIDICKSVVYELKRGERVIGYKSRSTAGKYARHYDFQFIIGRMASPDDDGEREE